MNLRVSLTKVATTLLAFLLIATTVPANAQEAAASTPTTTTRVLAINQSLANPQVPFQTFDGNPPKVYDINGDGKLEILAQNDNNWFYVFDSQTGKILFQAKTTFPGGWGARTFNGPEVAILETGGAPRIIVENSAAYVASYRYDHAGSSNSAFKFIKEWEKRLDVCYSNPGSDSKPVLADLDRDGDLEIIASTEENGVYALHQNGTIMWSRCIGGGNAEPTVADITGDGYPEVVFASDGGVITAMSGKTGVPLWSFDARVRYNLGSGSMPVGPAIGQLDGVGGPEIVVGARDSHDANNFANNSALLLALKSNGQVLWAKQDPDGNPLTYTHAIIADAEADGQAEVYWGDWNTMGHKPPWDPALAWQLTGPANYYRYGADGTLVWKKTLGSWWSNKDLAIGDVDGDGVQEVLANGPNGANDGIWYLDARTGATGTAASTFVDLYPWKMARGPILADLWNTGTMQIVVQAGLHHSSGGSHAVLVFDTHAPYSSVYPHLPYPALQSPIVEPKSSFSATFDVKSPNAWWQELYVKPDSPRTISAAEVRINNDVWRPMTKSSWGAWTSSYNTPAGTKVEFRATDGTQYSISLPFTWMDGTLSKRSDLGCCPTETTTPPPPTTTSPPPPPTTTTTAPPPPPTTTTTSPPTGFDARFAVSPNVNEWWVEVTVSANEAITNVDARVNGGAWKPLTLRSWGSWAESFNAPRNSIVEFRATSSTGAQDLSDRYCWMTTCGGPNPTTTMPPPPTTTSPPASFDANFFAKAVGNDWWVEVDVTAPGHTIATVEAQINGGTWRTLDKTSWGSWAKSFNVPNGSQITFRATNAAGATDLSSPVTWP